MKYFVTYCVMDSNIANPMWHACLLLSEQKNESEKIEVTNAWGYYPASAAPQTFFPAKLLQSFKKRIGFNFDLYGNFGHWKVEELRYLDLGYGLHGVTFDITLDQYQQLIENYKYAYRQQEETISEIQNYLKSKSIDSSNPAIFNKELQLACEEDRPPRLNRFQVFDSMSSESAVTCKVMAVQALKDVQISDELLSSIVDSSSAMPRYSGTVEDVFLYSEGPRRQHVSERTNKISFFREWKESKDKLFWTLPPLTVKTKDGDQPFLKLAIHLLPRIKTYITQLQRIELAIENATISECDLIARKKLKEYTVSLFSYFSTLTSKSSENEILAHLEECNTFLHELYFVINDDFHDVHEVEAVANRFDRDSKVTICDIIGFAYVSDDYQPACTIS